MKIIYEIDPVLLFDFYQNKTGLKLCHTCWTDRVKAYNFYRKNIMAKKENTEKTGTYFFKEEFAETQIFIKGFGELITAENLTNEIVEKYFVGNDLMNLVEQN